MEVLVRINAYSDLNRLRLLLVERVSVLQLLSMFVAS